MKKKAFENVRSFAEKTFKTFMAGALAAAMSTVPIGALAVEEAQAAPTVHTIDNSKTFSYGHRLVMQKSNGTVTLNNTSFKTVNVTTTSGPMTAVLAKISNEKGSFSYSNPYKIVFKNAGKIGGRSINVEVSCSKVTVSAPYSTKPYDSRNPANTEKWVMVAALHPGTFIVNDMTSEYKKYNYRALQKSDLSFNVTYADTGKTVDKPFINIAKDLDVSRDDDKIKESWTARSGFSGNYWLYKGSKLKYSSSSDGVRFYPPTALDTDGDAELRTAGVLATTNNGKFSSSYTGVVCGTSVYLYSQYSNIKEPVKKVAKTNDPNRNGDTVEFDVTQKVGNLYDDILNGYSSFIITDKLDNRLAYESAKVYSGQADITSSGGALSFDKGTNTVSFAFNKAWLSNTGNYNGQDIRMHIVTKAKNPDQTLETVDNEAVSNIDGIANKTKKVTVKVAKPQIEIEKSSDKKTYEIGEDIDYTVKVKLAKDSISGKPVTMTDPLPDGVESNGKPVVSGVDGTASIDDATKTVSAEFPELKQGETATIHIPAKATAASDGVVNKATATVKDGNTVDASCTIDIIGPGLNIRKSVEEEYVQPGGTCNWTVRVGQTQEGSTARNVVVYDDIDGNLTLDASSVTATDKSGRPLDVHLAAEGGRWTVSVPALAYGDEIAVKYKTTVNMGTKAESIPNTAFAYADEIDKVKASASVKIVRPELKIAKTVDPTVGQPGDVFGYTVEVNQTDARCTAHNVVISDPIPQDMKLDEASVKVSDATGAAIEGASVDVSDGKWTVKVPQLDSKTTARVTYSCTASKDTTAAEIDNTATAIDDLMDKPVSADAKVKIVRPALAIAKTVEPGIGQPGSVFEYGVEVRQTVEGCTAHNVVISDPMPDDLALDPDSIEVTDANGDEIAAARVTADQGRWSVTVPDLGYGEAVNVGFTATVSKDTAKTSITNTATAIDDLMKEPVSADAPIEIIRPALAIEKTVKPGVGQAGDTFDYTVKVNETDERCCAYNAIIEDDAPQGMELVADSVKVADGDGDEIDGTEVSADARGWTVRVAELPYGTTAVVTFTMKATEDAGAGFIDNTATAIADSIAEPVSAKAQVEIVEPELAIEKDVDKAECSSGDTLVYTVKVTEGNERAEARNLKVSDELPQGLTLVGKPELSGIEGDVSVEGNKWQVTAPVLKHGQTATIEFSAVARASIDGTEIVNTATAEADHSNKPSDDAVCVVHTPKLSVEKASDKDVYEIGETVHYTIEVKQVKENVTGRGIHVTDTLPAGMANAKIVYIEGAEGAEGNVEGDTISVDFPTLAYGQTVTIGIDAETTEAHADKQITNNVSATVMDGEGDSDTETDEVVRPALAIEKSVSKEKWQAGDEIGYTVEVEQVNEHVSGYNVNISDVVPPELELVASTVTATDGEGNAIDGAKVVEDGNAWCVKVDKLAYGEKVIVNFSAIAKQEASDKTIDNIAHAVCDYADDVSDDAEVYIVKPDLAIEKDVDYRTHQIGDRAHYTVKVTQTDPDAVAHGTVVTDTVPDGLSLDADSVLVNGEKPDEGKVAVDAETNTWTVEFGDLAFGEEIVVDFEATVDAEAFGKTVTNTATATADYTDEVSDDAEIDVIKPVLSIVKDVDREHVQKNDVTNYTVKLAQETPQAVARDVVMTDPLPEGLAFADGQPVVTVTDRSGAPLDEQPSAQAKIADDGRSLELACDLLDENMVLTVAYSCKVVGGADGEELPNTATATADYTDEVSDDAVVEIVEPVLGIAKDASEKTVEPDEKFTYTINVTQTAADAVAHDTVVTDDVPEGVSIVGDVAVEGAENAEVTVKGNRIEAHVGDIAYEQQVTVKFEAKAGEELAGKKFTNKAIAEAADAPEVSDDAVVDVPKDAPTVEKGKRGYDKTGADAGALAALVAALIASAAACGVYAYRNRREE